MSTAKIVAKLKALARKLKQELLILVLAYKDERVPWYAKLLSFLVVAYAYSPIDLIPEFIPIIGLLDDIFIISLGIFLAFQMIPQPVIDDLRIKASAIQTKEKPTNWLTVIFFVSIWLLFAYLLSSFLYKLIP